MRRQIASLHYLTQDLPGFTHTVQVRMACEAGVSWVQLRMKNTERDEWLQVAREVRAITRAYGATLIINDDAAIAKEAGADGVHLGQTDMHWSDAVKMLGEKAIIGVSAHSWDELWKLKDAKVHYAGLGPFRFTSTKDKLDAVLGLAGIRDIMRMMQQHAFFLPVIAIGGIEQADVKPLMETGIAGIAVSGAINKSVHPQEAARQFLAELINTFSENEMRNI
ncbi:MAG: thiamine phosphate synthase [Chitinophagales bacterium]|nr:thiamine phosphate synthase [Chitinophagales bacterium]